MITAGNSHCEHINADESHDEEACPGAPACAVADGLRRLLEGLEQGSIIIRRAGLIND